MTTSYYIRDPDGIIHYQGTYLYAKPTDPPVVIADPFGARITYYYWTDRVI